MYQLKINRRYYIFLPKFSRAQRLALRSRFTSEGFEVTEGSSLTARSSKCTLHIEPSGLSWASTDLSDYILPAVSEVLGIGRETVQPEQLLARYFAIESKGHSHTIRVNSRLESGHWDWLRANGRCALSPDEHLLARDLLKGADGDCWMVTDFAVGSPKPFFLGSRLYYSSRLSVSEASETLCSIGDTHQRNSFLPRDGVFKLIGGLPGLEDFMKSFEGLGDWCPLKAALRESSNVRPEWPCAAPVV